MFNFKGKKILVTGGAGFIGSNLVKSLLELDAKVIVLDNLETGNKDNLAPFLHNPKFEFYQGDICSLSDCEHVLKGVDAVSHQAALGSVPRSIAFPNRTHEINASGFLNLLHAATEANVKRFVYASSSSVYGDSQVSPKTIGSEGNLLSPYAVTKKMNEEYAKVYHRLHGMETVGLRYFNVFGPNQDPNGVYAAAIPKFIDAMLIGGKITIHGDGEQTRDFTFVDNAVQANLRALTTENVEPFGKVYNVACGEYFTLNEVIQSVKQILEEQGRYHASTIIEHGPERKGDIRNSLADISQTVKDLNYKDIVNFRNGIKTYLAFGD
jgi:UDP-N-acetylglucosamine/UDP-N-acetylgalactosamine 4-epimerase